MKRIKLSTLLACTLLCALMLSACRTSYGADRASLSSVATSSVDVEKEAQQAAYGSYVKGTVEGSTYSSTFLGLEFTLPVGFTAVSDDEANKLIKLDMATDKTTYELAAKSSTGDNIVIFTEKVENGTKIDSYWSDLHSRFKSYYPRSLTGEYTAPMELCGKSFFCSEIYVINTPDMNVDYYFYLRRYGDRMCVVAITCYTNTAKNTIIGGFSE